jgi:hypothetical protein
MRALLLVFAAVAAADAAAQGRAAPRPAAAFRQERAFATQLQDAVRAQNRDAVAQLLRYPARVSVHLRPFPLYVEDRATLLQMYDMVFTPQLRCAIVTGREPAAGEPTPKYPLLLARGVVSMAGGRIVAERSGRGMLITRVSSFGDTGTRGGAARQVTFDGQRREIQLAGRVPESGTDAYVVAARPRDVLDAKIDRFPDRTLELRVSRTGADYRVEIERRAAYCEPPTIPYLLTLKLKP